MREKLKSFIANDSYFYSVVILLVAVASFGLGRQAVIEENGQLPANFTEQRQLQTLTVNNEALVRESETSVVVVASKSGSKYHLKTCPGAKQIKTSNLIEFSSIPAAEAAGYTPAANCKF